MYQLCCKLRKLKQELKHFNKTHFSNISDRVKDAKRFTWIGLNKLCIQRLRIQHCVCEKEMLFRNYASTVREEECFFQTKARIQWLSLGDQNTSYFHKSVNGRQNRNKLLSLQGRMEKSLKDTRQSNQK
ncbi:hypothetical protein D5086_027105 [Populus alba]|uniref:Uncharacterized protein n=1 Tax=Populus alba TaxID=43335 RepID=A0ACC4B4G7_POPAL